MDDSGRCRNIAVDLNSCLPTVDGVQLISNFRESGVYVRIYRTHVRVSVPNCNGSSHLVMNVICQRNLTVLDPFTDKASKADMIKFVISRGVNLNENSHGLMGTFSFCVFESKCCLFMGTIFTTFVFSAS